MARKKNTTESRETAPETTAADEFVIPADKFKELADKTHVILPREFATGGYVVAPSTPIYQGDNLAQVHAKRVFEIEKYLMIYANGHVGWSYSDAFGTVLAYGWENGEMTWTAER